MWHLLYIIIAQIKHFWPTLKKKESLCLCCWKRANTAEFRSRLLTDQSKCTVAAKLQPCDVIRFGCWRPYHSQSQCWMLCMRSKAIRMIPAATIVTASGNRVERVFQWLHGQSPFIRMKHGALGVTASQLGIIQARAQKKKKTEENEWLWGHHDALY